ncbi:arf-GAP with Rho-GAP domain, ANK repeat and PH domain-containing protein 3 isoform X2 [Rhinatrema bivittatum]|uniref:arf-GAP with Rho-GAP domain, ANK repeat and PH domain-containing protein 3 isoform X2 n=1 Tax=Rhinatrema bivittatum TaxID=194408 RepID=UPI001126F425|nr:arf-GAP with Rho-GAP domain, ANK repeat and PH domain-containing protein 3 isoform X2 [Rhinatrema bivittatum]
MYLRSLKAMTSLCGEDIDIAGWLSAIHLEKYQNNFKQHGYHTVKDVLSLDNEALQQIGITATGHRKRILSRVRHISREDETQLGAHSENLENPSSFRASGDDAGCGSGGGIEVLPAPTEKTENNAGFIISSLNANMEKKATEPIAKPVPKPRTVFHKPLPAVKQEQVLAPTPVARTSVPSQLVASSSGGSSNDSVLLEGFAADKSNTNLEDFDCYVEPFTEDMERGSNEVTVQAVSSGDGKPLHSVTSVPSQAQKASHLPSLPNHNLSGQTQTSEQEMVSMSLSSPSSPSSPQSMIQMISNEIYCGIPYLVKCSEGVDIVANALTPDPPGREAASSEKSECPEWAELHMPMVPERPASSLVAEESISPYCETALSRTLQPPEQKIAKNPKVQACTSGPELIQAKESHQTRDNTETNGEKNTEQECKFQLIDWIVQNELEGYSTVEVPQTNKDRFSLPAHLYPDEVMEDLTISPYASFTSLSDYSRPVLSGWLDKLSPQGNYVFQRRFVKFDGKKLMYFSNDKEVYPKGVIPLAVIEMVRPAKENKFEVVTSHRIFVFRVENEAQRSEWCTTLQSKVKEHRLVFPRSRCGSSAHTQKSGYLELKGYKSKVFTVLSMHELWLYKNEQFFKMGIGISVIEMQGSTIRDARNKTFELITSQKIFSFTADSEREKKEWMEILLDSISETLSDYEVAEKIWSNKANKSCADCRAANPDWASINLCVVICKQCAGQHRGLGTNISKVQSLKLDISIWSNEIVQLFIVLGNERANRFWAARLPACDVLHPNATTEHRRDFIIHKYREGKYRRPHPHFSTQEEILQALCAAVAGPSLLKTVIQFFSDAESVSTADMGGSDAPTSPSQVSDPRWTLEGSSHGMYCENQAPDNSDQTRVYDEIMQPVVLSGYLYKTAAITKLATTKKTKDEFHKHWCSLERSLLFYENEKSIEPVGRINLSDVVCLGVTRLDMVSSPTPAERFRETFEIFLCSERMHQFGTDSTDTLQAWASAIGKWFSPLSCHCLLGHEFQRVGKLRYKAMLNPNQWKEGFFLLQKSHLFICPGEDGAAEDSVNLRRLQELTVAPQTENSDKKEVLILVEKGRTLYLQGVTHLDFLMWCADIKAAAGGRGNSLREQQLSRNDIPIIVDSCIAFITQYGLRHEGIYRKNGAKSRIKLLIEEFRKDARNVKLRISDNFIEDVTDVLKRFFRELEDPIFTSELHCQWKEAAEIPLKPKRLERYKEIINHLPRVNRTTLAALIGHLYRVQKCADLNQMCTKNLSLLFAPSLFQTDGKGEHEVKVMEDLIDNYVRVFNIDEEQVTQMDLENSLITTWKDVQLSQAGDLIIEVYLEKKLSDCCVTLKVSPTMTAEELANQVLDMRNVAASVDIWLIFEVMENGELERPLHPKEKVLEQALQWCKLPEPSSAYLLVKKVSIGEGGCLFTGAKRESPKCGLLKCREEPPKLLGCKFQERYFVIRDRKLLLLKEKKSSKPEREWSLGTAKVYMGIRKKLKPPSLWGFTVYLEKQQLYLCCMGQSDMWDWVTSILKAQHDDLRPVILRRHSSSDLTKQKFGTMPLVPIRGDDTNSSMVSANQMLPMKMHQDSLEEQNEKEMTESEPVYEEVGNFTNLIPPGMDSSLLADLTQAPLPERTRNPIQSSDQTISTAPMESHPVKAHSLDRGVRTDFAKTLSLERGFCMDPVRTSPVNRTTENNPPKTASLERNLNLGPMQAASGRSHLGKSAVDFGAMRPLFFEPLPLQDPSKAALRKKSAQLPSPMQDKLMQELSTVIQKKSEPEIGAGQQVT